MTINVPSNRVKIHLLKQANSQAAYDAIETKEPNTLYVLANGRGYLGATLLFTGDDITANLVQDVATNLSVTDKAASSKAVADYVAKVLDETNLVKTKFFRGVRRYALVEADFTEAGTYGKLADKYNAETAPNGCNVGDLGLLFTADNNATTDGVGSDMNKEMYYWICLNDFLNIYTAGNTNSIHMQVSNGEFTANLNLDPSEKVLNVGTAGVKINKTTTIATDDTPGSDTTVVTEKAVKDFVKAVLEDALAGLVGYTVAEDPKG